MNKLAMIALLAIQAIAMNSVAAESKTLVFCNTQNAIGQQAVVEVTDIGSGRRLIQISLLGVSVLREEVNAVNANQYGASYVSKTVSLSTGLKATDIAPYATTTAAKGILTAKVLGANESKVNCEIPR